MFDLFASLFASYDHPHPDRPQASSSERRSHEQEPQTDLEEELEHASSDESDTEWELTAPLTPDDEFERVQADVSQLRKTKRAAKAKYEELGKGIRETRERLSKRETQRKNLKAITQELAVAQRFLNTADSISQGEVVSAVEALNEEIFQLTSIVADKVQVETQQFLPKEKDAEFRKQIHEWILSKQAFLDVVVPTRLEDPLAIQIGWQGVLSYVCRSMIASWDIMDTEVNEGLGRIYKGILSQHDQAVAGRWRSLTLAVTSDPSSESREQLLYEIIRTLAALPVICGYIHTQESYDDVFTAFWERLLPLLDKCLKLRKTVGQDITSMDIHPHIEESGAGYDFTKADLEYEEEDGENEQKKGIVACSLGLGLCCDLVEVGTREDGSQVIRHRPKEMILKPKVILMEALKNIIS